MNRGRHKKSDINQYPIECKDLKDFNTFRKAFTVEQAKLLIANIYRVSKDRCNLALWEENPTNCISGMGFIWSYSLQGHRYWDILINNYVYLKNKSK